MANILPREELLHYLWRVKGFELRELKATSGQRIKILQWGSYNRNAGPDFLEASVEIAGVLWSGHVEMHVLASDWYRHQHEKDPAYESVILHVVHDHDRDVRRKDGTVIPCLCLKERISDAQIEKTELLLGQLSEIPCRHFLHSVEETRWSMWLDRMLAERLEQKARLFETELVRLKYDWDQLLFQAVAKSLGQPVNGDAMWELARRCPLKLLRRLAGRELAIEAVMFGQSGLLSGREAHTKRLRKEYRHYQKLYQLEGMEPVNWRFMRMRPPAFPSFRIAQLSSWIDQRDCRMARCIGVASFDSLKPYLQMQAGEYWGSHFRFGKKAKVRSTRLGNSVIVGICINAIAPLLYLYGDVCGEQSHNQAAFAICASLKAENNRLLRIWKKHNIPINTAAESQAIIHLTRNYCLKKRCLSCAIGHAILR